MRSIALKRNTLVDIVLRQCAYREVSLLFLLVFILKGSSAGCVNMAMVLSDILGRLFLFSKGLYMRNRCPLQNNYHPFGSEWIPLLLALSAQRKINVWSEKWTLSSLSPRFKHIEDVLWEALNCCFCSLKFRAHFSVTLINFYTILPP